MTYVISNIHGNYTKFQSLLSQISFRDRDTLYLLGDLLDYGEGSMELIADISVRLNVFAIAGEHDFLAARMLKGVDKMLTSGARPDPEFLTEMAEWVQDGGQPTLDAFRALDADEREGVLDYLEEMTLYEEVEVKGERYVLVHAGIADYSPDGELDDYLPEDFFSEPLDASRRLIADATVVVGHTPTASGRIERGEGSIFLDCGVAEGGRLACLCLESGEEFYA
ncbi:MAG: serine/threonine protein phosphatase [Ruminococcaceae bacterium]|nr:serine/threonine protein phosphatase [Oscillospiraceae bacterium]